MKYLHSLLLFALAAASAFGQQYVGSPNQIAEQKFYDDTATVRSLSVDNGDREAARSLAKSLLEDAEGFPTNWNYGNAIHAANIVLGRIAVREDDLKAAGKYLLAAGNTPGSPQLDTFGPDMNLARELLIAGDKNVVQKYFELCAKFWKMNDGKLKEWSEHAENGKVPDFGPNLRYYAPPREN